MTEPKSLFPSLHRGGGPLASYGCACPWQENADGSFTTFHADECPFVRAHRVNWAGILVLDPIPGLDPGIAPWVELLRAHRIETHESCQGGPDPDRASGKHAYAEPTIAFSGGPEAGYRAYAVAITHALPLAEIRRVWKHDDHELNGPVWQIVFTRQATEKDAEDIAEVLAFERGDV